MTQFSDEFLQELLRLPPAERERRMREALAASSPPPAVNQAGQSGGTNAGAGNTFGDQTQFGDQVARDKAALRLDALNAGRDAFVATQQTIHLYYGAQLPADAAELLSHYLKHFAEECNQLRLQRISGQRQTGGEQPAVPALRLQDVYTSLTTDGPPVPRLRVNTTAGRARRFLERLEKAKRSPADVAPERVISAAIAPQAAKGSTALVDERMLRTVVAHFGLDKLADESELDLELQRPELVIEAIARQRRLVLLGEPGSGKSTVLRYLGYWLARRAGGAAVRLKGWPAAETPLPILVPLAQVAERLGRAPDADQALWQTLGAILDGPQGLSAGLLDSLREALRRGGVILLCDGLDELSAEGGAHSPRTLVSQALQRLVARSQARIVITSRILPYTSGGSWQLPADEQWQVRTITPLAFGQVKIFVQAWFHGLAARAADLTPEQAQATADELISQLAARPALAPLVATPLLLTMLTLLHDNDRVPENEVELYEQCVELLLDRWEPVRQPGAPRRPGLIERLGNPPGLTLARLRDPLHHLAYDVHREARGEEGRGVIRHELLRGRLQLFFERLQLPDPLAACKTFEQVLAMEAGLLVARGDDAFAFPHLSFQEYLAACYLANHAQMKDLAHAVWLSDDGERWRKTLLLLAGRLAAQGKAGSEGLFWLKRLWGVHSGATPKPSAQWAHDVRLAVLSYQAMGGRIVFASSSDFDLQAEIETPLRQALQGMLADAAVRMPPGDRLLAGQVLGELGDRRFPLSDADWQASLAGLSTTLTATGEHYWRYVPAGRYRIGGWDDDSEAAELDLAACWVARLPVTVAQFARFVAEGYSDDRYWTPNGLRWRKDRSRPYRWGDPQVSAANQPVVYITWYEATAFCAWLTATLARFLPAGFELRLPTEAEWEVAAAYAGPGQRRDYPWGPEEPTADQAVFAAWRLAAAAPVGLCPAGAAACGALDLVGNVWEWCSSSYREYPAQAQHEQKDFTSDAGDVPIRGYAYYGDSTDVRCGARGWDDPGNFGLGYDVGLRVVLAPRLAHLS